MGAVIPGGAIVMTAGRPGVTMVAASTDRTTGIGLVATPDVVAQVGLNVVDAESDTERACYLAAAHTRAVIAAARPLDTVAMIVHPTPPHLLVCHHQMAFSPRSATANFFGPSPNASWILERWWHPDLPLADAASLMMLSLVGTGYATSPLLPEISVVVTVDGDTRILSSDEVSALVTPATEALERLGQSVQADRSAAPPWSAAQTLATSL